MITLLARIELHLVGPAPGVKVVLANGHLVEDLLVCHIFGKALERNQIIGEDELFLSMRLTAHTDEGGVWAEKQKPQPDLPKWVLEQMNSRRE